MRWCLRDEGIERWATHSLRVRVVLTPTFVFTTHTGPSVRTKPTTLPTSESVYRLWNRDPRVGSMLQYTVWLQGVQKLSLDHQPLPSLGPNQEVDLSFLWIISLRIT